MTTREDNPYGDVVFYQLNSKFVDTEREMPQETDELMYYSLSVGHHVGVIDCFEEKFRCPWPVYLEVVEALPEGSEGRYKLEGIQRHGEIQIDKTHIKVLDEALVAVDALYCLPEGGLSKAAFDLVSSLEASLQLMRQQPAIYLMGRRVLP